MSSSRRKCQVDASIAAASLGAAGKLDAQSFRRALLGSAQNAAPVNPADSALRDWPVPAFDTANSAGAQHAHVHCVRSALFFPMEEETSACTHGTFSAQASYRTQPSMSVTAVSGDMSEFQIERATVTRAVKNLRFNESPVFMLNDLEGLGIPERVNASESLGAGSPIIAPAIKVRDFNFTSLSDAI